jgi:hypothetical protein
MPYLTENTFWWELQSVNVVYGNGRIKIPLLQPVVITYTTAIFKVNFQRVITRLFTLTVCRCGLLLNDLEY